MAQPEEWVAHCDISFHSQAHVHQDGAWSTVLGEFKWTFTCKSYMGGRQKEGDGVSKDEGRSKVGPEDGGGEDQEGAGEVDQVKERQSDHQAGIINDKWEHIHLLTTGVNISHYSRRLPSGKVSYFR